VAFCADTPVLVAFGENSNILPVRSDDDVADVSINLPISNAGICVHELACKSPLSSRITSGWS
jgi:hypothetical protein